MRNADSRNRVQSQRSYPLQQRMIHENFNSSNKKKSVHPVSLESLQLLDAQRFYCLAGIDRICLVPLVEEYIATYNPAYPWWMQFDWLLLGNFLVMSMLIMANANLRRDVPIVLIGFAGGMVIESWGTQTELWTYYTSERPPLWIIPAWPIASLSIDRLFSVLRQWLHEIPEKLFTALYKIIFAIFYALMLIFVWPTINKSLTVMALFMCAFLILTPQGKSREIVLAFFAGAGLGYFLELWGTTRLCWTYYTLDTPPIFAVLAHGMAAVAFWRVKELWLVFVPKIIKLNAPAIESTTEYQKTANSLLKNEEL